MAVPNSDRFTKANDLKCPVCGGDANVPKGRGERCWGYQSGTQYVFCTNDRFAGSLGYYKDTSAFRHFLGGPCYCGATHETPFAQVVNINSFKNGSGNWWTWPVKALYEYHSEDGNLAYRIPKHVNPADPTDKAFPPEIPDGKGGWKRGLNGARKLLFHLPQLIAAPELETLHVTEGEKDVLTAEKVGYVATCNTGGAGHWHPEFNHLFQNRDVVIHQDNDQAGEKHTALLLKNLLPVARSVKVITYPELPEHGDISDWIAAGHTREELENRINQTLAVQKDKTTEAQENQNNAVLPEMVSAFDLLEMLIPPPAFIIEGLLPDIGTAIIGGAAGIGKSMLSFNMARDLVMGRKFLGQYQCQPVGVLYLSLESNQRRDQFRLRKMLGNLTPLEREKLKNLHIVWDWQPLSEIDGGLAQFDKVLETHPEIKVIIVDIMQAARPAGRPNKSDAYQEFYAWGHKIRKYAFDKGRAIVFVHHTNKGRWDNPFDALSGATSVAGTMNTKFMLKEKNPETHEYELEYRGNDVDRGKLALQFDGETYTFTSQGDASVKEMREERVQVLQIIEFAGPRGISPKEIASQLGKDKNSVNAIQKMLGRLVEDRLIYPVSYGYYALTSKNNYQKYSHSSHSSQSGNSSHNGQSDLFENNSQSPESEMNSKSPDSDTLTDVTIISELPEIPAGLGELGNRKAEKVRAAQTVEEIDQVLENAEFDFVDRSTYQRFYWFADLCKRRLLE